MRSPLRTAMGLAAFAMVAAVGINAWAATPTSIPFIEEFNYTGTSLHNAGPWTTNETGGAAIVQTTNVLRGAKAAKTSLSDLTLQVDTTKNYTNTWCMIWTKPTLYDDAATPTVPTTSSAAFYVNTGSVVKAMNGANWTSLGTVNTSGWIGFAVHSDYVNDKWSLYVCDNTSWTANSTTNQANIEFRRIGLGLGMGASAPSHLTNVTIEGVADLDTIALGPDWQTVTGFDGRTNVMATAYNLTAAVQTALPLYHYATTGGSLDISTEPGHDLFTALANTDQITAYDSASASFPRDSTDSSGWDVSSAPFPTDIQLTAGTALWVKKTVSGPLVMFTDYATASQSSEGKELNDTSVGGGLNYLAWSKTGQSEELGSYSGNGAGFDGVARNGDWLYLRQGARWKLLGWNGRWRDGSAPATVRLTPGQIFWYLRMGTPGTEQWDAGMAR